MARLLALCSHVGVRKWAEQIGRHSLNPPPFQLVPVPQVSLTDEFRLKESKEIKRTAGGSTTLESDTWAAIPGTRPAYRFRGCIRRPPAVWKRR